MDVTTARAEVESWLRALAAPLAPWAVPRPAPSVPLEGSDAAGVSPTMPATPSAGEPAAPAAVGAAGPAIGIPPCDITTGEGAPGRVTDMSARLGPDRLAATAPGTAEPAAEATQLSAADAANPGPAVENAYIRPTAGAADTNPDESADARLAALVSSQPELAANTAPAAPGPPNWPALVSPGEDRPAGRDGASWTSASAWRVRPDGDAELSAEIGAALAPLLPAPGGTERFDPLAAEAPKWTSAAGESATEPLAAAYPYGVGSAPTDPAAVADLADLLAGVLEDETRALGVLELEP